MRIALLTFDGFDELGTFVALGLLNRLAAHGWKAQIACPGSHVTSLNGVTVEAQQSLEFAGEADAVVFGHSLYSRAIADNGALLDRLQLDPVRQLFAAQCGGSLLMARLGLLGDSAACADSAMRPWLIEAVVRVEDAAFHARGSVATAAGGLASQYLAAWLMVRRLGFDAAAGALHGAAPVGEQAGYVLRLLDAVRPFVSAAKTGPGATAA